MTTAFEDLPEDVESLLRLGGGPGSGLALRLRLEAHSAYLELVRPCNLDDINSLLEAEVLLARRTRFRDVVDKPYAQAAAVNVAMALRLPLAELYSSGPHWLMVPPRTTVPAKDVARKGMT